MSGRRRILRAGVVLSRAAAWAADMEATIREGSVGGNAKPKDVFHGVEKASY